MSTLHPTIAADLAAAQGAAPYYTLPIGQARTQAKRGYALRAPRVEVGQVSDITVPGPVGPIGVRMYRPANSGTVPPLLVFFHGSGFTMLDLDTHDDICRRLCAGSGAVVASVDYRLAPEHPYPAGGDDCHAAVRWLVAQADELRIDAQRLALAGDSAGACLAAATALRLRDEGAPMPVAMVMWYPVTDHASTGWATYREFGQGYGLTAEGMRWFWSQYLPDEALADQPYASPLRAPDLRGLPATCILTAEFDVLRDEGEALAHRLRQAGVAVTLSRCAGMNHGFLKYAGVIDQAGQAMQQACDWLRGSLRWPSTTNRRKPQEMT